MFADTWNVYAYTIEPFYNHLKSVVINASYISSSFYTDLPIKTDTCWPNRFFPFVHLLKSANSSAEKLGLRPFCVLKEAHYLTINSTTFAMHSSRFSEVR